MRVAGKCCIHSVVKAVMAARVLPQNGRGKFFDPGQDTARVGGNIGGAERGAFAPSFVACVGKDMCKSRVKSAEAAAAGQLIGAA